MKAKKPRELPPDWWCEGQTNLLDAIAEMEDEDASQEPEPDPA